MCGHPFALSELLGGQVSGCAGQMRLRSVARPKEKGVLGSGKGTLERHGACEGRGTQFDTREGGTSWHRGREERCTVAAGLETCDSLDETGVAAAAARGGGGSKQQRGAPAQDGAGGGRVGNRVETVKQVGGERQGDSMLSVHSMLAPLPPAGTSSPAQIKCPRSRHTDTLTG